jgi:hypothetical protein
MRWFRARRAHDKSGSTKARGHGQRENNCEKRAKLGSWLKDAVAMRRGLPGAAHALTAREEAEGPLPLLEEEKQEMGPPPLTPTPRHPLRVGLPPSPRVEAEA